MAKNIKSKVEKVEIDTEKVSVKSKKTVEKVEIEMIKEVAGMKIGDKRKVPFYLANQMVQLGNAKII